MTDHKLLLGLLAGDCQTPQVLFLRMLHWTVFVTTYSYCLLHRLGKAFSHTDALSHCPLLALVEYLAPALAVLLIEDLPAIPFSVVEVMSHLAKDHTLAQVLH